MLPQQYCLRWKYHHSNLQTMFSQLLDRGCFCDVTLACEGQLIRAHRVVLCACSTFFDTVLTNYSNERDPIIIMKDVTFSDVKCLIEFMYKGEINVEHSNLASLLKTADDLKIKGLAEVTWRDDEDSAPIPTPATEFFSPRQAAKAYYGSEQPRHSPTPPLNEEGGGGGGGHANRSLSPIPLKTFNHLPQLTPIALTTNDNRAANSSPPLDHYLGAKRKRGRPPLDDAYDVFNIRNMAQYSALDHQNFIEASRHFAEEHKHLHFERPVSPSTKAAVAAYHEHIHQHQELLRQQHLHLQKQQQEERGAGDLENDDKEKENHSKDSEWISSNMEKVPEPINAQKEADLYQKPQAEEKEIKENNESHHQAAEEERKPETYKHKKRDRKKSFTSPAKDKIPKLHLKRKSLNEENLPENSSPKQEDEEKPSSTPRPGEDKDEPQEEREIEMTSVPKPVEEIENAQPDLEKVSPSTSKSCSSKSPSPSKNIPIPPPLPSSLRSSSHYNKFAPEGYLVNEHGILMAPDFIHAPTVAIPKASTSGASGSASSSNGTHPDHPDFLDVKMEDYDAADLRLTSEEITQWQDVIKMDDYLAKGRRPQFWEEPFTRRVLDAIKNKHLEMKKAARILGVSYGTLYGRYREVYGCLKHPYNGTSLRPSQLNLQARLDFPLRAASLPAPIDIGKIRPKDLSELWARPQI